MYKIEPATPKEPAFTTEVPLEAHGNGDTSLIFHDENLISFHNLSYTVRQTTFMPMKRTSKIILNDVRYM